MPTNAPSGESASPKRAGPDGAKAVHRTARVLMELAAHPEGVTLSDVARTLGEPLPTLHRTLAALRSYDLVRVTEEGQFALGASTVVLASSFSEGLDLRDEAKPAMAELRAVTQETVHLGVLSGAQIVYVEKLDSPNAVRMVSRVGGTNPACRTAIGQCVLAYSPSEVLESTLELTEVQYGHSVERTGLEEELKRVREKGYGTDLEKNEIGICCVGAPVHDHSGKPVAGISVSTPTMRFEREREAELGALVASAGENISRRLGYAGPYPSIVTDE